MSIVLYILCILSFLGAVITTGTSITIFQQITGCISFVTSAILLIGACIVRAIDKLNKKGN